MKRTAIAAIAAVAVLGVASAYAWRRAAPPAAREVPTARVQRGRVQVTVHTMGELRAARTAQLFTPAMGGPLQVVRLVESGAAVKAGEPIVEFDPAEQAFALEQARFDLRQAEQEMMKADADAAVQGAEDEEARLLAKFDVRRAELTASANELKGAIEAQQNLLLLDEAKQKLAQLEHDLSSHGDANRAAANVAREKRNKAELAVQVAERNIRNLRIDAQFDGYVMLRQNMQAFGGIVLQPSAMPEYRVGDAAYPGQAIADLIDNSRVEVIAKLAEADRASVAPGQAVDVAVDALPDAALHGSVRAVSGVASRQMWDIGTRQFDVTFDIIGSPRVRPGVTAAVAIAGPTFENVLFVPRTAVFDVAGRPTVYVRVGDRFEAHEVRLRARTESLAIVENLDPNADVALINPNAAGGSRPRTGPSPAGQRASR